MRNPFRLVLQAREQLYRSGLLRTHRLRHPVISIGNLTLGGTGKTPLTIFLAEKLQQHGFRPVILSRGYRRRSRGTLVVSRGDGPLVPWQESGDEPSLMARRLAGVAAVVVGESRYLAGQLAEREGLGNLFLLDDGFQHRQLHRDFDIVTIDPAEWQLGEALLPTGRWREPKSAITRAHAACIQDGELALPIPQFRVRLEVDGLYRRGSRLTADSLNARPVNAFAGIAKPDRFFATLESMGFRIARRASFPDHHQFTDGDLRITKDEVCITTEKDAVKLEDRADFLTLRVSANIAEFDRLKELILERLASAQCR